MEKKFTWRLGNRLEELAPLADAFEGFVLENHVNPRVAFNINLIFDEMITNIINYGYRDANNHEIGVDVTLGDEYIVVRLEDDAAPFDPLSAQEPDTEASIEERSVGGLGIHLVKQFSREMSYKHDNGKNILTIILDSQQ